MSKIVGELSVQLVWFSLWSIMLQLHFAILVLGPQLGQGQDPRIVLFQYNCNMLDHVKVSPACVRVCACVCAHMCVCVCVCEREREKERERALFQFLEKM
jgi:hypothetical protein